MTNVKRSYSFNPAQGVPPGVAPFSHATRWGDLLFVTGQMPTDPATGQIVPGDVVAQADQVCRLSSAPPSTMASWCAST